jgi:hypothetical protein
VTTGVKFLAEAGIFSLRHSVHTGSGVHPASYQMSTGGSFPGNKVAGGEADHSPPSSAKVRNGSSYISTPPYVFMERCFVKHRDNFTFLYLRGVGELRPTAKQSFITDKYQYRHYKV